MFVTIKVEDHLVQLIRSKGVTPNQFLKQSLGVITPNKEPFVNDEVYEACIDAGVKIRLNSTFEDINVIANLLDEHAIAIVVQRAYDLGIKF